MKIKIITYGCSYNRSDSQIIQALLEKEGHKIVEDGEELTIINTCTVKKPTENKILRQVEKNEKPTLLTGCLVDAKKEFLQKKYPKALFAKLDEISSIPKILAGKKPRSKKENKAVLNQPNFGVVRIIPISEGCLSNCNYCATKIARGKLRSFPIDNIIKKAENQKEIWITSQDASCYGLDIGTNLAELVEKLGTVKGKVRIGIMNPTMAKSMIKKLVKAYKADNIFKFLHIPVQTGSDKVLKEMNRGYSTKDYKKVIQEFRKEIPEITISTDIIVGYPTETWQDFEKTIELIKETRPTLVNISMYWEMSGTKAAEMKQIPHRLRKERSRILTTMCRQISLETNSNWIGWQGEVLIDEEGKHNTMIGRNYAYKQVILKKGRIGETARVKITGATDHHLIGERVKKKKIIII